MKPLLALAAAVVVGWWWRGRRVERVEVYPPLSDYELDWLREFEQRPYLAIPLPPDPATIHRN